MARLLFPFLLTISGCAVLLWLGFWQLERLDWKEGVLAELDAKIAAAPIALPEAPTPEADNYRAVALSGQTTGQELYVLDSGTAAGTGHRVIAGFDTGARRVLLDLGLMPIATPRSPAAPVAMDVTGNLIWPDDVNSSTPEPEGSLWFGRDVVAMAATLGTDPIMVVAATTSPVDSRTTLLPVGTSTIKNDHWEYSVTWFGLAAVWAIMGAALIRRNWTRTA